MVNQKLIEFAQGLVQGRGDGRISEQDAEAIWKEATGKDNGKLNGSNSSTLFVILNQLNWTPPALIYVLTKVEPGGPDPHPEIAFMAHQLLEKQE